MLCPEKRAVVVKAQAAEFEEPQKTQAAEPIVEISATTV